jgi:tetratricopeptide (TPR) repeat protein
LSLETTKELKTQRNNLETYLENNFNIDSVKSLADIYFKLEDVELAISEYEKVLQSDSSDYDAMTKLARSYVYLETEKDAMKAEDLLTKVIASKKYSGKELAKIYLYRAEARDVLSSKPQDEYTGKRSYDLIIASKLDSLNPEVYYQLGIYYDDNGYYESALESFAKAISVDEDLSKKEGREPNKKYYSEFNRTKKNYLFFGHVNDANKFKIVSKK